MEPVAHPRVKICCITSTVEARLAIAYGAAALGLVSEMPSGPGVIDEALIADIAAVVPPPVATFLLTCNQDPEAILRQQRRSGVNTLQLCDELPASAYARLRTALPDVRLVQVIHVTGPEAVEQAISVASEVDGLLLDSGQPALPVRELGGTGRVHNWQISREIRKRVPIPVFLAGGLTADNVTQAIQHVQPFAVDVCTGVRADGKLDEAKLAAFMRSVTAASAR